MLSGEKLRSISLIDGIIHDSLVDSSRSFRIFFLYSCRVSFGIWLSAVKILFEALSFSLS